jgi:Tfp pilus assembly protein PilF
LVSRLRADQGADRKLAARLVRRADILIDRGRHADALDACRQAIAADAGCIAAYRHIGALCLLLDQPQAACDALDIVLALAPGDTDALSNAGAALRWLGRPAEARQRLEAALRINPGLAPAWFNLGLAQADMQNWAESVACHARALQLAPRHAKAAGGMAASLLCLGRAAESAACARQALRWAPQAAELHVCLAEALLSLGDLTHGWADYEWRWLVPGRVPNPYQAAPLWRGETLAGRRLLVHAEQGFGDVIQMCRYVPLIRGADAIVFEVPRALLRLFRTLAMPAGAALVARGDALPAFDVQCPTMSLPLACGAKIPADVPYLHAAPAGVAVWQARLAGSTGVRVGLCWQSGVRPDLFNRLVQTRKSVPLPALAPLADVAGCSFVSLQTEADFSGAPPGLRIADHAGALSDFADTAALMACLDLVVTVDTAVAHLAGAMGVPVWLLNRFDADWRWCGPATWYSTVRQFRQATPGDWAGMMAAVADALRARVAG